MKLWGRHVFGRFDLPILSWPTLLARVLPGLEASVIVASTPTSC